MISLQCNVEKAGVHALLHLFMRYYTPAVFDSSCLSFLVPHPISPVELIFGRLAWWNSCRAICARRLRKHLRRLATHAKGLVQDFRESSHLKN